MSNTHNHYVVFPVYQKEHIAFIAVKSPEERYMEQFASFFKSV